MKLTVNIFEDFINTLTLVGEVISFSDNGTSTTLTVNKTFHVREGMNIIINGSDFVVESVVVDATIVITGLPIGIFFYSVAPPFYFHGTPRATNSEINEEDSANKAPMIYLAEILREKDLGENSAIIRDSEIRLFFLDEYKSEEWDTDEIYSNRLDGLNSLVDQFLLAYKKSRSFYSFETEFTRINYPKWGVISANKGAVSKIFDHELTGVELTFTARLTNCEGDLPPFIPVCGTPANWDDLVALIGRGSTFPQVTGQETSFISGDDVDIENSIFAPARAANSLKAQNGLANFTTLINDNEFGNTERFTDINGVEILASGDNYMRDNYRGLDWYRVVQATADWPTALGNALASTQNGFTDWFVPGTNIIFSMWLNTGSSPYGVYFGSFANLWTSSTRQDDNTKGTVISGGTARKIDADKTSSQPYLICRKRT